MTKIFIVLKIKTLQSAKIWVSIPRELRVEFVKDLEDWDQEDRELQFVFEKSYKPKRF